MHNILGPYVNFPSVSETPKDLVTFSVSGPQRRQLWSSAARSAVVLRTTTQFSRRAFSVCGPDIWNSLSVNIRFTDSHAAFRRVLKTHFFNIVFI